MKIGHINICSLRNKVRDVEELLYRGDYDILAICETWLDSSISDAIVHIPGYHVHRLDRKGRRGGGVCLYSRVSLIVSVIPHTSTVEAMFIRIQSEQSVGIATVGCVYRPPDSSVSFWESLPDCVDDVSTARSDLILVGDFNVDTLRPVPGSSQLNNFCLELQVKNAVTTPTRWPSGACLDLVLFPKSSNLVLLNVTVQPLTGISDHHLVTACIQLPSTTNLHRRLRRTVQMRYPNLHHMDKTMFEDTLRESFLSTDTSGVDLNAVN